MKLKLFIVPAVLLALFTSTNDFNWLEIYPTASDVMVNGNEF